MDDEAAKANAAVGTLDPHGFVPGVHAGIWFVVEPQVLAPVSRGVRGPARAWLRLCCVALCRDGVGRGFDTRHQASKDACGPAAAIVSEVVGGWDGTEIGPSDEFVKGMSKLAAIAAACPNGSSVEGRRVLTLANAVSSLTGMPFDHPAVLSACRASTRRLAMRIASYMASLDGRAVRLLDEHEGVGGIAARCWSGLDMRLSADAPLAAAWEAMPGHALALAEAWLASPARFRADLARGTLDRLVGSQVVRSGHLPGRLVPTLARIDRLLREGRAPDGPGGHLTPEGAVARYGMPLALARRLTALPAGWEPSDDDDCIAFIGLASVVDRAASWSQGGNALSRILNAGGRWSAYAERLRAAAGGRDAIPAIDDCLDMVRAFQRQVHGPAVLAAGMAKGDLAQATSWSSSAWRTLLSGRALPAILEASARWHRTSARTDAAYAEAMSASGGSLPWGAGLPDAFYGNVQVRVLTDDASLLAEGSRATVDGARGLSHCVGGYGPDCRAGLTRVVSMRRARPDGTWDRLSTASFDMGIGRRSIVAQHRGFANADPPQEAVDALASYVRDLRDGTLTIDAVGLAKVPEPTAPGWSGAMPLEIDAWTRVRDAWAPLLPGTLRTQDRDAFAKLAKAAASGHGPMWLPATPGTPGYATLLSDLSMISGAIRGR